MFTFNKSERLYKQKDIAALFKDGNKIIEHPVLFIWNDRTPDDDIPLKVAFSVSKKKVKSAVKRNRIKRQMREIYRIKKNELYNQLNNKGIKHAGMLIYISEEQPDFKLLKKKIIVILNRYTSTIESYNN